MKSAVFAAIKEFVALAEINGGWPSRYLQFIYRYSWGTYLKEVLRRDPNALIWLRNSSAFNQTVPGLSDIDITIVSEAIPILHIQQWNESKRLFPWHGEINYYPTILTHHLGVIANPGELKRDPKLMEYLGIQDLILTPAQIMVVLIRMLQHDRKSLVRYPLARKPKWIYGLKILGFDQTTVEQWTTNLSLERCLTKIIALAPSEEREDLKDEILNEEPTLSWLYPQINAHLSEMKKLVGGLSKWKREIILEQCLWEFWGVMTQTHWLKKDQIIPHLTHIKLIMDECKLPLAPERESGIKAILDYLRSKS